MSEGQLPKIFISYSWDDGAHREWVKQFATRLRGNGIDVTLDRWHAVPGDQLPEFMERAVRDSVFVLCICTPNYKKKSDQRSGGVGYEGDIMTDEVFISRNQRKFIPVLRNGEWKDAAPSWLRGKYYIDLSGNPYNVNNYKDLMTTLRGEREEAPPLGGGRKQPISNDDSEFVNREIELATLNPVKLQDYYWQCALISSPTGYGKTRLLKRLIKNIQDDSNLNNKWNCCYIDLQDCDDPDHAIAYIMKEITGETITSDLVDVEIKNQICSHINDKMSLPLDNGSVRGVLLIIDSIDYLTTPNINWFSSVIHEVIICSYVDYETGEVSIPIRIILSGVNTESFWNNYLSWEISSKKEYRLMPPKRMPLSAFDDLAVQDLIKRRAITKGISLGPAHIQTISNELQYLSGGHPQVVSDILDELVVKKFQQYKKYIRFNRERLIKNHVSKVAKKILHPYPIPIEQRDIQTICIFRLIDLNTLRILLSENLVSSQVGISTLGSLCENKILNPPNAGKLFYHDDIIRRILYLDLAFGDSKEKEHVQKTHQCAKRLYREWIEGSQEQHSLHYFFVEWLFHALQINNLTKEAIIEEWEMMLSEIKSTFLPPDILKQAIKEKLETDSEVKYLYRECFGSDELSELF